MACECSDFMELRFTTGCTIIEFSIVSTLNLRNKKPLTKQSQTGNGISYPGTKSRASNLAPMMDWLHILGRPCLMHRPKFSLSDVTLANNAFLVHQSILSYKISQKIYTLRLKHKRIDFTLKFFRILSLMKIPDLRSQNFGSDLRLDPTYRSSSTEIASVKSSQNRYFKLIHFCFAMYLVMPSQGNQGH
jgi:hypothetical protein